VRAVGVAVCLALVFAAACGSRGPLDIGLIYGADGGDGSIADAAPDVANADASSDSPAGDAAGDAAGDGAVDAGPLACAACIAQNCGADVLGCVTSTTCRTALTCVAQKCLNGGNLDPQCLGMCTNNDPMQLAQLFAIFQCVITSCGPQCAGALGGLGGGGGGSGDGG
jgi:hypothetical protein